MGILTQISLMVGLEEVEAAEPKVLPDRVGPRLLELKDDTAALEDGPDVDEKRGSRSSLTSKSDPVGPSDVRTSTEAGRCRFGAFFGFVETCSK